MIRNALFSLAALAATAATVAPSAAEARTMTLRQDAMIYLTADYQNPMEPLPACMQVEMIGEVGNFAVIQAPLGVFFLERRAMTPHARVVCGRG
ncbi:hypothetical protein JI664_23350 [Rhodobacter sp. NTK016B]|uniref:hypothetical protein n=1 Tax=Rhodobacter sp. NTK016B TaxID=2759676 RepID=UPI001A8C1822|nr:hypothetical protein [Rhodobacter sp. NTK016B]MBN8294927.1 hypothetical protein [Rhodobacter sp. NTK016B]